MILSTFLSVEECVSRLRELSGDELRLTSHYMLEVDGLQFSLTHFNRGHHPPNDWADIIFRGTFSADPLSKRTRIAGRFSVARSVRIGLSLLLAVIILLVILRNKNVLPDAVPAYMVTVFTAIIMLSLGLSMMSVKRTLMRVLNAKRESLPKEISHGR
jgi:hypothetical protein